MSPIKGKPHKHGIIRAIESLTNGHERGVVNGLSAERAYTLVADALGDAHLEAVSDMHYAQDERERFDASASPAYLATDDGRRELNLMEEAIERAGDEANYLHVVWLLAYNGKKRRDEP